MENKPITEHAQPFTVLLGYLDGSDEVSAEHVYAATAKDAVQVAKWAKFAVDPDIATQADEEDVDAYPVLAVLAGHHEILHP